VIPATISVRTVVLFRSFLTVARAFAVSPSIVAVCGHRLSKQPEWARVAFAEMFLHPPHADEPIFLPTLKKPGRGADVSHR